MSPIFRNLGKIPEETAHVLQNLVGAKGFIILGSVAHLFSFHNMYTFYIITVIVNA